MSAHEAESPWRDVVANVAIVTTVAQFLAGSLVIKKFIKRGSTGDDSGFPFVCGFLSCSLWLRYGWMKNDGTIVLVNCIGLVLLFTYVVMYYRYVINKKTFTYQTLGAFVVLGIAYSYTMYESDRELVIHRMGYFTCFVMLVFIGAPLTMLFHVIKVKSTESLPFPIIVMSFVVSTLWYMYGMIIDDNFVIVSNAIAVILAAVQLMLFLIYPSIPPSASYSKLAQMM